MILHPSRKTTLLALCCLFGTALASQSALAQSSARPAVDADTWQYAAGAAVGSYPKYPGSAQTKISVLPVFSARYGQYFIGGLPEAGIPVGAGAYLLQGQHWRAGAAVGINLQNPRKESDDIRLKGLGDISATTLGSAFVGYNDAWFGAGANVITDVGGKGQGTRVSAFANLRHQATDKLTLTAGPGLTWADGQYNQKFFGINAAQSALSGRAAYTPGAGLNAIRFSVGANYALAPQWSLGTSLTTENLRGDAAKSPVTEKRSHTSFRLSVVHQF